MTCFIRTHSLTRNTTRQLMYDKIVNNEIKLEVDVFSDQEKSGEFVIARHTKNVTNTFDMQASCQ
jgi:hypothetical protein